MKKITEDIENYIRFLERSGYTVSLSFDEGKSYPCFFPLLQYDLHPHRICNYLKHNKKTEGMCVLNKKNFKEKDVTEPYYACCYAGVEEFIVPVVCDGVRVACVHVSGYRGSLEQSYRRAKRTAELCDGRFRELYSELSKVPPSLDFVLSFTRPLTYMLIEFYRRSVAADVHDKDELYYKALRLIYENEIEVFNCRALAERLNYSESHLRQVFKKADKMSLQAKVNQIRLEKAKRLLRGTNESVTRIAFSVGFSDSNYFSTFFKRKTGLSPLAYRKSFLETEK